MRGRTTAARLLVLAAAAGCAAGPRGAAPGGAAPNDATPTDGAPGAAGPGEAARPTTFANPLDIEYRFMPEAPSRREAADPMVVRLGGEYYLFASKSGGYWHSPDMRRWTLVEPTGLPIEDYAPSVVALGGRLYYTAHKSKAVFTTDDPRAGRWRKVAELGSYADPALFADDDGRLYLYHGSALNGSIAVVELDPRTFAVRAGPDTVMTADHLAHGWERSGADNLGAVLNGVLRVGPYVEGAWMTKHAGTYYLQYAAPGTIWKSYADGVYTSRSPTRGFTYAPASPFSYKPGGFVGGAGHSGTFQDAGGNYWRVTTMIVSVAHKFERRLGIFPAGFDADGTMRNDSYLGDYPQYLPGVVRAPLDGNRPGWMVLSFGKATAASSALDSFPAALAADEDIRTQWVARTGDAGERLTIDLGAVDTVRAVQVNLGEYGTTTRAREHVVAPRWLLEASTDGRRWWTLADRRANARDAPHEYVELARAAPVRWVRLTNVRAAAGGRFAVRDLRVFGRAPGPPPAAVPAPTVARRADDDRTATLAWPRARGAERYVVRYGIAPDRLHASYEVGADTSLTMNSLNRGVRYWFAVDAVSGTGVTRGGVAGGG